MTSHGLPVASYHLGILPITAAFQPWPQNWTSSLPPRSTMTTTGPFTVSTTLGGGDSGYGSGYGGGTAPTTIQGSFQLSYDLSNFTAAELQQLKVTGQNAMLDSLATLLAIPRQDLHIRYVPVNDNTSAVALFQQSPTAMSVTVVFSFLCPADRTPDAASAAVSQMGDTTLAAELEKVMTAAGVHAASMHISVSYLTSTWWYGTPTTTVHTTGPSSSSAPFSSTMIHSTTPATTTPIPTTTTTTPNITVRDIHPCVSWDDFMPEKKMNDYGWCDASNVNISESTCVDAGCYAYGYPDYPYCSCPDEATCHAVGLSFIYHTCEREMGWYTTGEYSGLIMAAHAQHSCAGLETSWHQNIADVIEWPARMCCKSWPKKLCDSTAVLATPCKDPADFMEDRLFDPTSTYSSTETCGQRLKNWWSEYTAMENATKAGSCDGISLSWGEELKTWVTYPAQQCCQSSPATLCKPHLRNVSMCAAESDFRPQQPISEHCALPGDPPADSCTAAGCTVHGTHCHCETASGCQAVNGTWHVFTCQSFADGYLTDMHALEALIKVADGQATCEETDVHGQNVLDYIAPYVQKCCSSFPKSICDKTAQKMSYCKGPGSFKPNGVLYGYCHLPPAITEESCKQPGLSCGFSHSGHCWCEERASCETLGGLWEETTCGEEVDRWSVQTHAVLQEASASEDCSAVPFDQMYDWLNGMEKCCSDWPANLCDKDKELATVCKDPSDFLPQGEMHAWCNMYGRNPEDCAAHGCSANEHGCHCSTPETCSAVGGIWKTWTCIEEAKQWQSKHELLKLARETETCDGDWDGQTVLEATDHLAKHCCASYPATVCQKDSKYMTPCKNDADFMKNKVLHGSCSFPHGAPTAAECIGTMVAQGGCEDTGAGCTCQTEHACLHLNGVWTPSTCGDEVAIWDLAIHRVLQAADQGTCDGLTAFGQPVPDFVEHMAKQCCSSFPATVCDKSAKRMTPCQDKSDFTPDTVMWSWCHIDTSKVSMNGTVCNAQPSCQGDDHWCHCWQEQDCLAMGGTWNSHTCEDELDNWRPDQHRLLQWAEENNTCVDHDLNGWRAEDMVSWPAQMCCSSYPSTLCDHDVEPMTPCKRKEDFLPDHIRYSGCWIHPSPDETQCHSLGCTWHETWCECKTKASCDAAGGVYHESNCTSETSWWQPAVHK
ncbi:Uncharacterized protein SCF082_LOCUS37334, partial [Durusdinium trenchii]